MLFFAGVAAGWYILTVSAQFARPECRSIYVDKGYGISINSPTNNATVCNSFSAYGTSTTGDAVSGSLGNTSNGNQYNGTVLQQPTGPNTGWCIQFTNIPNGTACYNMDIWDNSPTHSTSTGLTVSSAAC